MHPSFRGTCGVQLRCCDLIALCCLQAQEQCTLPMACASCALMTSSKPLEGCQRVLTRLPTMQIQRQRPVSDAAQCILWSGRQHVSALLSPSDMHVNAEEKEEEGWGQ